MAKTSTKGTTDEKKKVQSTEKKKTTTKGTSKDDKVGKTSKAKSTTTNSSKSTSSKTTTTIKKTTTKKTTVKKSEPVVEPTIEVADPNDRTISNFLNNVYSDSALYMNYRSTPSYIDGLKNSGRKCLYTVKKRNLKTEAKVANFAGAVIEESNYLHGNTSMEGTIVTLSQDFCGSNNLPTLKGIGAFGTRFTPEAAASRYIFIKQTDYMDEIFKKEDDANLVNQEFEGDAIEPVFYVPTLPMLLVNGSFGVGVGFKADVLSRSLENVFTMVRNKLSNKKLSDNLFIPSWKGFNGTVKSLGDNKWEIRGNAEVDGNKVTITELPISWDLQAYTQHLKDLRDMPSDEKKRKKWVKKIEKFIDYSEDDIFKFEVRLTPNEASKSKEQILSDLGVVETFTEILTCIDENNAIKEFNTVQEIFDSFYKIKIQYLKKRISSEIKRIENELQYYEELYRFIMEVVKGTINIKLKKADVEATMRKKGYINIDRLISIPLYSVTEDKAEEAKKKLEDKKVELESMKKETPENVWVKDLDELEKALKKVGRL